MSNFNDFFPPAGLPYHEHVGEPWFDDHVHDWADITTGVPTEFPPAAHDHTADTWFINALAGKADLVHDHTTDVWFVDALALKSDVGHLHTIAEVSGLQPALDAKEDAITYGAPEYMAVANATSDGFNFIPQPDQEFYRLRGSAVPYTGVTPDGFADTVGDNIIAELVAGVAPVGLGDPSGVTYRCSVDLGSVIIHPLDPPVVVTAGDLIFWSGDSNKWLHLPNNVADGVSSVNTKTGDVIIAGGTDITVTDGGASTVTVNVDPASALNWDTAFGWGDHALAGYALAADLNIANWDAAFGWGDHSLAGYITDAPADGNQYARKDGAWVIVEATQPALTYALLSTSITLADNTGYLCDSTLGALSLILPVGADNVRMEIIDNAGMAGTNNITILPNGTDTIMGGTTFILNAGYQGVEFVKLGTDWKFIGSIGESVVA